MTLRYWESVGGTLIEEFRLVPRQDGQGQRLADAVIIPTGPRKRLPVGSRNVDVRDKDVIVVQTKASRLCMYLLGQALFSAELLKRHHKPRSVRSVAVCTKGDQALEEIVNTYPELEVVVMQPDGVGGADTSLMPIDPEDGSVSAGELYEFILRNTEEVNGQLLCRVSLIAELKRRGVPKPGSVRANLVRELTQQGLVLRPHPRAQYLVVTPGNDGLKHIQEIERQRVIDRMNDTGDGGGTIITHAPNARQAVPERLAAHATLTKRRVRRLDNYLSSNVLTKDRKFICASKRDCKTSIAPGCSFQEPFLSYVGSHYDLERNGEPMRIVVVGQEVGKARRRNATMEDRAVPFRVSAYEKRLLKEPGAKLRNPHMRGTTLALRTILNVPGWNHASEFIDFDGRPVHLFDCMALVNRLLCSAHVTGTSNGKSTKTMLVNCERHFQKTLRILEPTIVVLQGVRMWKWSQDVLVPRRQVTKHLVEAELGGSKVLVAAFTHPSARGEHRWDSPASPYFKKVVRPTLKRAVDASSHEGG